jgi:uncharacterized RDD family membrane protein YckC
MEENKLDEYSPEAISGEISYAGFWVRFAAFGIDAIVVGCIYALIFAFLFGLGNFHLGLVASAGIFVMLPLTILIVWIYPIFFIKKYQATLGKMVFGIKVISASNNSNVSLGKIILRETLGKWASSIMMIGYVMVGLTEKKQALHDIIASTIVVYKNPAKKTSSWIIASTCIVYALFLSAFLFYEYRMVMEKIWEPQVETYLSLDIHRAIQRKETTGSFGGFTPTVIKRCGGEPIVNVSPDGQQLAIFSRSCSDSAKYYCADSNTRTLGVNEEYAKSGNVTCAVAEISKSSKASQVESTKPDGSQQAEAVKPDKILHYENKNYGLSINYGSDWSYSENNSETVVFNQKISDAAVHITKRMSQVAPQQFVDAQKNTDKRNIITDDKDFSLIAQDGSSASGRQVKIEDFGHNYKSWIIAATYRGNLYTWVYFASSNNFDVYKSEVNAMLDSWKIIQ